MKKERKLSLYEEYIGKEMEVVVPEELEGRPVRRLGSNVFDMVHEVILPDSLYEIGEYAFSHCWSLKGIELPKNLLWISEYTFYRCANLEKVVIHEKVEEIQYEAFSQCFNLREAQIEGEKLKEEGYDEYRFRTR